MLIQLLFLTGILTLASAEGGGSESEFEGIPGAGLSIVFIFGGLLYSGIMKMLCRKIKVILPFIMLRFHSILFS